MPKSFGHAECATYLRSAVRRMHTAVCVCLRARARAALLCHGRSQMKTMGYLFYRAKEAVARGAASVAAAWDWLTALLSNGNAVAEAILNIYCSIRENNEGIRPNGGRERDRIRTYNEDKY